MIDIKNHTYLNGTIKLEVPFDNKTYINATKAAKAWKKKPETWLKTDQTKDYVKALSDALADTQLVIVQKGGNASGTWIHPKLAVAFSRWLDPAFAVWCDQKIDELLSNNIVKASNKEVYHWTSKLPELYKSMTIRKHWGPKFKKVVNEIELYSDKLDSQKDFVRSCAKKYKGDKVKLYNRMIEYYRDLFEEGAIDRRTWEDMTNYMFIRIRQILTNKITKDLKKTDVLVKEYTKLQEKTRVILDGANNPPIPVFDMKLESQEDLNGLIKLAYNTEGLQVLYSGFLEIPSYGGQTGANGKTRPLYVNPSSKLISFTVACWPTRDASNLFVKVESMMKEVTFNCTIKNGLFYGFYNATIGVRYYCVINPSSLATIVYKYTIKQI